MGDGSDDRRWAWIDQPTTDPLSWALALALFAMGFGLICLSGARSGD